MRRRHVNEGLLEVLKHFLEDLWINNFCESRNEIHFNLLASPLKKDDPLLAFFLLFHHDLVLAKVSLRRHLIMIGT